MFVFFVSPYSYYSFLWFILFSAIKAIKQWLCFILLVIPLHARSPSLIHSFSPSSDRPAFGVTDSSKGDFVDGQGINNRQSCMFSWLCYSSSSPSLSLSKVHACFLVYLSSLSHSHLIFIHRWRHSEPHKNHSWKVWRSEIGRDCNDGTGFERRGERENIALLHLRETTENIFL